MPRIRTETVPPLTRTEIKQLTLEQRKERYSIQRNDWEKRNPEKARAKVYARRYTLKDKCEVCGSTEGLSRHHPDYTEPLLVFTLCKECHGIADVMRRKTDNYGSIINVIEVIRRFKKMCSLRKEIHYTIEDVRAMPRYYRDKYEREITKVRCENNGLNMKGAIDEIKIGLLEGKLEQFSKILDEIDTELKSSPQPQDMNVRISALLFYRLREALQK